MKYVRKEVKRNKGIKDILQSFWNIISEKKLTFLTTLQQYKISVACIFELSDQNDQVLRIYTLNLKYTILSLFLLTISSTVIKFKSAQWERSKRNDA